MKMIRSVCLLAFVSAMLTGCVTTPPDPNAPTLTDKQRQIMQIEQGLDTTMTALLVADLYVGTKSDEWTVEKYSKYKDLISKARIAVGVARDLLAEGNITSAESQRIIIDAIMKALEEVDKEQPT